MMHEAEADRQIACVFARKRRYRILEKHPDKIALFEAHIPAGKTARPEARELDARIHRVE